MIGRNGAGVLDGGSTHTVAGQFRPVAIGQAKLYNLALVIGGSLLIGIAAQVTIPLPMVPITGQTFAVLLLGALLGARLGVWTVLAYIMEGALGLPVFSEGRSGCSLARRVGIWQDL
jgi:biotin transporter BioY